MFIRVYILISLMFLTLISRISGSILKQRLHFNWLTVACKTMPTREIGDARRTEEAAPKYLLNILS
jgi:hypothetical protein